MLSTTLNENYASSSSSRDLYTRKVKALLHHILHSYQTKHHQTSSKIRETKGN